MSDNTPSDPHSSAVIVAYCTSRLFLKGDHKLPAFLSMALAVTSYLVRTMEMDIITQTDHFVMSLIGFHFCLVSSRYSLGYDVKHQAMLNLVTLAVSPLLFYGSQHPYSDYTRLIVGIALFLSFNCIHVLIFFGMLVLLGVYRFYPELEIAVYPKSYLWHGTISLWLFDGYNNAYNKNKTKAIKAKEI